MTDRLIVQSIGGDPADNFLRYMELEEPIHRDYAARCGADYHHFVGRKDERCNPTWNRVLQILEAFEQGYRKVVWLDADVLVVQPDRDIFAETPDDVPLVMTRTEGFPWRTPDGEQEAWNDGVLIANAGSEAEEAMRWLWDRRCDPFLPHQIPGMPELSWLLDWIFTHPGCVAPLSDVWNFLPHEHTKDRAGEAVIEAFHGMPHRDRWEAFLATYNRVYGGET